MSATAVELQPPATWSDPKRYAWLLGLLVPLLPFMAWGLVEATGLGVFWFWGPCSCSVSCPCSTRSSARTRQPARQRPQVARAGPLLPLVHLRVHPAPVRRAVLACWLWASGDLSVVEALGLALTIGIRQRHRDQHRARAGPQARELERWLSKVALAQTGYGHFFIEHNRGHHVRVATPEDPASSRLGESF